MIGLTVKIGVGLAATAGVATAAVMTVASNQPTTEQATVVKHVDGDTFDVQINGATQRIRLLNIDTPETVDPNKPVQCLGPEASEFLAAMLPIGSSVRLEFDKEREDRYGRTLAAAFTPDGKMVNAEVARAGFAQVVTYDDNVRFRPPIEQAAEDAATNKRGLHSSDVQCTFLAQVKAVSDSVAQGPTLATQPAGTNSQGLTDAANRAGIVTGSAIALVYALDNAGSDLTWMALTVAEQAVVRSQALAAKDAATREETSLRSAATTAQTSEQQAAQAAAQAEADRVRAQQAAAQAAEERRVAAQAQRDAAAAARASEASARRSNPAPKAAPKPQAKPEKKSSGSSGYTGPRCYAPGGKTYRPC
ncbi:MAG TPA: thermonuclease family protein [Pseudonocardia sp.]|nr:thermonuclease family protein [Pseudonocardia sp.]